MAAGKRWAKESTEESFKIWWRKQGTKLQKRSLPAPTLKPSVAMSCHALGTLLAARSHHGDFASYHERFQHQDANLRCSYGARKTPEHPFLCKKLRQRHKLRYHKEQMIDLDSLITTREGEACYASWIKETTK